MFEFKIKNEYKRARVGFFNTPHGKLETPNMAIVATHGKMKLLDGIDQGRANPDLTISNTFHLFVNKKVFEIKRAGGLHKWSGLKNPMMTDSGGFQVFSLGWGQKHKIGKIVKAGNNFLRRQTKADKLAVSEFVKIYEKGVIFKYNNKKYELTPEKSIKIQKDLGADIIFAFDECTSPLHSHAYTKSAMERTHRWAVRSLKEFSDKQHMTKKQALFGIVQGGVFEDLRKKSSKFIGALDFKGFGVGGCFGEKQMRQAIGWSLSGLPIDMPRHLLGIGKIKDIFIAIKQGVDLFDCVVPTREARHGVLYTKNGKLNIQKEIFSHDKKLVEKNCKCWMCQQGIKKYEIRQYFKNDLILGQKLATFHNIQFFKELFEEIRSAIVDNELEKLEKKYYNYF